MPTVAELTAKVSIDSANFDRGLSRANDGMDTLAKNAKAKLNQSTQAFQDFGNQVRPIMAGVAIAMGAALGFSIKKAVDFDSLKRGLTAVAGSAGEAEKQLVRLKEVAKLPGLGFEEAIRGSINLQAAGVQAQLAEKALMGFGNALATVGRGKAELDGVIVALTQMSAKGKIMAQEINQIAERVPQIRKVLQDAFGTSSAEEIQNMGLTFEQFLSKVTVELDKITKVTGGSRNSLENLMDAVNQAAAAMGDVFLPTVEAAAAAISQLAAAFVALPQPMQSAIGWITAATLGLGLLAAAIVKVHGLIVGLKAVIATGVFAKIGAGLAAWGVGVSSLTPALALAATGWTLMAASAVRAFAASEKARGEIQRVAAIVNELFIGILDKASGSIERLRAEWAFAIEMFGQGKVPTALVEGFRIEVERLGFELTETGIIAKTAFAKMSEAIKEASLTLRNSLMSIDIRAGTGALSHLDALKARVVAIDRLINQIAEETAANTPGASTIASMAAATALQEDNKKRINDLVAQRQKLEAEILKIETDTESSQKRQAEWLKKQEDAARKIAEQAERFRAITTADSDARGFANFGLDAGLLDPLEAAQMKLQSIDNAIQQLFQHGIEGGIQQLAKNMEVINRLLGDRKHALIQVAAAEKVLEDAAKARGLADFYAARAQKQFIENVMGLAKAVSHAMTQSFAMAREAEHIAVAEMAVANAINAVKFALQSVAPIVKDVGDKLKKQAEKYDDFMQELTIKMIGLTKGATAAAKAVLMLVHGFTEKEADAILALQKIIDKMEDMRQLAEDLANGIADAFLNGLRRVREEGFAGLLRSFEEMLFDMAMAFLRSQLVNLLTSFFSNLIGAAVGGGSGAGGGSGHLNGLPGGFGGYGGGGDFGGGTIVYNYNTWNVQTPDLNSFRQSSAQQQIAALQLATANAMRTR